MADKIFVINGCSNHSEKERGKNDYKWTGQPIHLAGSKNPLPLGMGSVKKADSVLNHKGYKNIACSVSGGADSDILVDICEKVKPHGVRYVWFDTGIEYQATKEHLKYLENHYGITIERESD